MWLIGLVWLAGVIMSGTFLSSLSESKAERDLSVVALALVNNDLSVNDRLYNPSHKAVRSEVTTVSVKKQSVEADETLKPPRYESSAENLSEKVVEPVLYSLHSGFTTVVNSDLSDEEPHVQTPYPILIVYPDELVFEFPKSLATPQNVKRAMARLLLSSDPYHEQDWLAQQGVPLHKKPYFYKKVLDHKQQPLRYPFAVYEYADYLMQQAVVESREGEEDVVLFQIPVVQREISEPIQKYHEAVSTFSTQFNIAPDLVFAIMEVESSFNPKAVSRSNAMGLMQLKADAAGKDVYQYIDSKEGKPSQKDLFDSENNIRMGTAYLSLLKHDYLSGVRNKKNKELLAIASYNGGLSTVLKLFADTKERAIAKINRLHPRQVYRTLRYQHDSNETRRYLDKVLQAKDRYRKLLDDYV